MNNSSRRSESGFTVIELIAVIIVAAVASTLFFIQNNNLRAAKLDTQRKTAINAIYYDLEKVFYAKNGYYPVEITEQNMVAVDPNLLVDTNGTKISDKLDLSDLSDDEKKSLNLEAADTRLSEYIYSPINCSLDGKCKGYTLRVSLSSEGDYVKKSQHN